MNKLRVLSIWWRDLALQGGEVKGRPLGLTTSWGSWSPPSISAHLASPKCDHHLYKVHGICPFEMSIIWNPGPLG